MAWPQIAAAAISALGGIMASNAGNPGPGGTTPPPPPQQQGGQRQQFTSAQEMQEMLDRHQRKAAERRHRMSQSSGQLGQQGPGFGGQVMQSLQNPAVMAALMGALAPRPMPGGGGGHGSVNIHQPGVAMPGNPFFARYGR